MLFLSRQVSFFDKVSMACVQACLVTIYSIPNDYDIIVKLRLAMGNERRRLVAALDLPSNLLRKCNYVSPGADTSQPT